jgi:hypothetical protein
VFQVLSESGMALSEYIWLLPVGVRFWQAPNINLVSRHVPSEEIHFSVIGGGIESVRILAY